MRYISLELIKDCARTISVFVVLSVVVVYAIVSEANDGA